MSQPIPWLLEIVESMKEIGGYGTYNDLYNVIVKRNNMDFKANKHWKAAVRRTIENHSSDSDAFAHKKDIFYSVEGKGKRNMWIKKLQTKYCKCGSYRR